MPKGWSTYDGVYELKMMLISVLSFEHFGDSGYIYIYPRFVWFSGFRGNSERRVSNSAFTGNGGIEKEKLLRSSESFQTR